MSECERYGEIQVSKEDECGAREGKEGGAVAFASEIVVLDGLYAPIEKESAGM